MLKRLFVVVFLIIASNAIAQTNPLSEEEQTQRTSL